MRRSLLLLPAALAGLLAARGATPDAQDASPSTEQPQVASSTLYRGIDYVPAPEETGEAAAALADNPVLKRFAIASMPDHLVPEVEAQKSPSAGRERIAIDKKISVPLVHDVQNDPDDLTHFTRNDGLLLERKYLNWGATTRAQINARKGHYFTITWVNDGSAADFVARFEYRQVKSKQIIRTLAQPMRHAAGANRAYFAVVGPAYLTNGPISSWRFTVLRGDTIVAETQSSIW